MSEELKPCPFCGAEPVIWKNHPEPYTYGVMCTGCGVDMNGATKEEAIAAWNRRAEAKP